MPPRNETWFWTLLPACCLVLFGTLAFAPARSSFSSQQKSDQQVDRKKPVKPDLGTGSPQATPQKGFKIGVNVDLVVVHTSVFDKNGELVSGLRKENFKVFEDGVSQNIISFSQEDVPLSLGLILDTSGSMRGKFDNVIKSALGFIRASNPDDEVFLISFNDEAELLVDYTSDIDSISDALENAVVTGGTALWDAIYLGVEKAHIGSRPKKAVIVFTDGEDKDSYYSLDEMVAKVQESDVQIYGIGFLNAAPKSIFRKSEPEKAHDALVRISEETGAKAFFPKDLTEMPAIVAQIAHELRNQYSISYVSSNAARDGTWRRVKVALDAPAANTMHVHSRSGYFAPKTAADGK